MRLSRQLLCMAWIASTFSLLCVSVSLTPGKKSTDVSLTGTSIHSQTFIEPAESNEDNSSEEDDGKAEEDGEEGGEDEGEDYASTDEPPTPLFTDFDDSEDLDALAKGILGSKENKESVAHCFGTWWPSSGGYVYYYQDYGNGGTIPGGADTGGGTVDDYGDYNSRRSRRMRRRRRMRRNRTRRARTSRRSTKKKA